MIIKQLVDEDFVNYKHPSMFIGFPTCTFKCEKECGLQVCQNSVLARSHTFNINQQDLVIRYMENPITKAIVCGGLEPMDSFDDLIDLVKCLREKTNDDIVIYTGYYKSEIQDKINILSEYKNIVVKFGRFIPNQEKHYDKVLGVYLASNNQEAERIS